MAEKRKIRTTEEVCKANRKLRDKLYYQRRKVKKQIDYGDKSPEDSAKLNKQLFQVSERIVKLNVKLFKCSKRYGKIKERKRSFTKKKERLISLLRGDSLDKKERKKALEELNNVVAEIEDMNKIMSLPVSGFDKKGHLHVAPLTPESEMASTSHGFWEIKDVVRDLISSGSYDKIVIDGTSYEVGNDNLELMFTADRIFTEISEARKLKKVNGSINIVVDAYEKERKVEIYTNTN